jgi:hypothetical protein
MQTQMRTIVEAGSKPNIVEPGVTTSQNFDMLMARCDRGIARACLIPATLVDHQGIGSYALGSVQHAVWETAVLGNIGELLKDEVVREQLLIPLVEYNFGPNVPPPLFEWKEFSEPDRLAIANLVKIAANDLKLPLAKSLVYKVLNFEAPKPGDEVLGGELEPDAALPQQADDASQIDGLLAEIFSANAQGATEDDIVGLLRGGGKHKAL